MGLISTCLSLIFLSFATNDYIMIIIGKTTKVKLKIFFGDLEKRNACNKLKISTFLNSHFFWIDLTVPSIAFSSVTALLSD